MANPHTTPRHESGKPPAFQFYPNDFTAGTRAMTLIEVGAYIRLLCHQWDNGSIPDGDGKRLAIILGCNAAQALKLWGILRDKFICEAGECRNSRLERERVKQIHRREQSMRAGIASGNARSTDVEPKPGNASSTDVEPKPVLAVERPLNPSSSSSSSSTPSVSIGTITTTSSPSVPRVTGRSPSLLRTPLDYDKKLQTCAYVGARLEVPSGLHANLVRETGGANAHGGLLGLYAELDAELEQTGEAIFPNAMDWTRAKWRDWMLRTGQIAVKMKPSGITDALLASLDAEQAAKRGAR